MAILIAIPLGVWLGHLHRGSFVAINASNIGRALPSLAVISIGIGILGIGFVNVLVALVILAGPVMLTNAYVAVDQVDPMRCRRLVRWACVRFRCCGASSCRWRCR